MRKIKKEYRERIRKILRKLLTIELRIKLSKSEFKKESQIFGIHRRTRKHQTRLRKGQNTKEMTSIHESKESTKSNRLRKLLP